ncbi:MAG: glycosyltransferase family 2 protein [Deltaproteobacteria bacterium]|nr:glycosyltransferase family 2 protein [Deltaproteobacteria bacterium]
MKKVLIIIPAFNEEEALGGVIKGLRLDCPTADILVVNDGSLDKTASVARSFEGVSVLTHRFNLGIGAAMQSGYKFALSNDYDIAVQFDGDGQHPSEGVGDLLEPLLSDTADADMVVGSRFLSKEGEGYSLTLARGIGIAFFSKVVSFILGQKFTDTTSGFRAVNKDVIKFFASNYPEDYPEVEVLVLLRKKGFTIKEIPVTMSKRKGGKSSITPALSVFYMIKVLLAIMVDLIKKVR